MSGEVIWAAAVTVKIAGTRKQRIGRRTLYLDIGLENSADRAVGCGR
jgi:hypothetical protein